MSENLIRVFYAGLLLSCVGCSAYTEGWKITAATEYCAQRGGVDHIEHLLGDAVVCRDGFWSRIEGKK